MRAEVVCRAADLAALQGPDVNEALRLWDLAKNANEGRNAQVWLSVAFLFSRHHRLLRTDSAGNCGLPDALRG